VTVAIDDSSGEAVRTAAARIAEGRGSNYR
jgi:hypothetical protein